MPTCIKKGEKKKNETKQHTTKQAYKTHNIVIYKRSVQEIQIVNKENQQLGLTSIR